MMLSETASNLVRIMRSNWLTENRFSISISCSSIEPEILEALVQLPKPLRVVCNGLTGVRQRAFRLVGVAQDHIGPYQPQPSLHVIAVLLQPGGQTIDHATDHGVAVRLLHVLCRGDRIV